MSSHLPLLAFEIVSCLAVILVGVWVSFNGSLNWGREKFNFHPLFMVLGYVFFTGHALVTFKVFPFTHRVKKYIHAGLNLVSAVFVTVATVAVFQYHAEEGYADFGSLHSWLGLACLLVMGAQLVGGLVVFQDYIKPGIEFSQRKLYKPWHVALGITMVTLIVAAICTGLQEQYGFMAPADFSAHALSYHLLGIFVLLWAFAVIYILLNESSPRNEGESQALLETKQAGGTEGDSGDTEEREREARRAARRAKREAAR